MRNEYFLWEEDGRGRLLSLAHPDDAHRMNWIEGAKPWGSVSVPAWPPEYDAWGVPERPYRLDVRIERAAVEGGRLRERYIFENHSDFEIWTLEGDVGIRTPFNDSYESAAECKARRCNAHVWCGGEVSWVMALRMGGDAPHLGMALTEGALGSYSVERDVRRGSDDRGDIILHPTPMRIPPGGSCAVAWELFWFASEEEFWRKLRAHPRYIEVRANRFIAFEGEQIRLRSSAEPAEVVETARGCGERRYEFSSDRARAHANLLVLPPFEELLGNRVRFIARRQQCLDPDSALHGAYLIYDNAQQRTYYSHVHDHNAGRERVGMGALMARYLRSHEDAALSKSLDLYLDFVLRELFDEDSGTVFNDCGRSLDWHRIYNYGWMIQFFCELGSLRGDPAHFARAARAACKFYASGGDRFYPIGLDAVELCARLEEARLGELRERVLAGFAAHARNLLAIGTDYPPQEVRYEQSIVQPAAELMLQAYELFGDGRYLDAAREHIRLLDLFNGRQPDYHLNEAALRHWDGYWFGGNRLLGDTFPHYWSALTGQTFARYAKLTGDSAWAARAERALRGPLSMFRPDGSASCAMVFPRTVNGRAAHCWDPWANDQDWAMYYYLKWHDGLEPGGGLDS